MQHLKILIVEDEILIAEKISDILKSFEITNTQMAHDKNGVVICIENFTPDIVLLDIWMEQENTGLQIGEILSAKKIPFIYITSHSDIATMQQIVKTKPFGYLSKPLKKSDLLANLLLFKDKQTNIQNTQITVTDNGSSFIVDTNDIIYIKSEGHYITVYCKNDTYVFRKTIENFYNEINNSIFYKPHRSYIVNLTKIKSYTKTEILIHDAVVPISRLLVNDFLEKVKCI